MGDAIEGESREVGQAHAAWAQDPAFQRPCVILSGGETTVTLRAQDLSAHSDGMPKPQGGRAGEYALGLAKALTGQASTWAIAADTDGIDGSQDNAGVLVAPDTLARSEALGVHIVAHLSRYDSYGFFKALDDLVVTGPTFTNVNDFRALLLL
jgi:hydroxypyruvate reductase